MSSSVTVGSTWLSDEMAVVGQIRARRCPRVSAARRSRRAASSRAGSRACWRGSARTGCSFRSSRRSCPRLFSVSDTTWPTSTPLMRTSDCSESTQRAREGDGEAVALRFQRQRAAEGLPQEQQQPEAAEHEQDDHEDVADRGSALLHRLASPRLRVRAAARTGTRRRGGRRLRASRLRVARPRAGPAQLRKAVVRRPESSPAGRRARSPPRRRVLAALRRARARGGGLCGCPDQPLAPGIPSWSAGSAGRRAGSPSGSLPPRLSEIGSTSQLKYTRLRPSGPFASALLTTLLRSWLPQSRKNRKPALLRAGVVGELVEEFVEHGEADREFRERLADLLACRAPVR